MPKAPSQVIEKSEQFERALTAMNGESSFVFITGRAGTGKSTLLRHFRETTPQSAVFLAPTGVAALNINGETIHSFFHFTAGVTVNEARRKGSKASPDLYENVKVIVIDEISMVRADLLDCVDAFLRAVMKTSRFFGGKRIIAIGDLYQLPPVVRQEEEAAFKTRYPSPYFFSSDVVQNILATSQLEVIELDKVYRQNDPTFISVLNGVRNRSITEEQLRTVNARINNALRFGAVSENEYDDTITLTTTNAAADEINTRRLGVLTTKSRIYSGKRTGDFPQKDLPTEELLRVAVGARIMMLANDPLGRWVNGSLGTVIETEPDYIKVELDESANGADGQRVYDIEPYTWTLFRSTYDTKTASLGQEKLGSFSQFPLKLAWATTIHKSQGKTFDKCIIDLGRGAFAAGQVYVALSRCRTIEGITLIKPVTKQQLFLDSRITEFLSNAQNPQPQQKIDALSGGQQQGLDLDAQWQAW